LTIRGSDSGPEKLKCADYSVDDSFACYSGLRKFDRRASAMTIKESPMWSRAFVAALLLTPLAGCVHLGQRHEYSEGGVKIVAGGSGGDMAAENEYDDQVGDTSTKCAPACPPKPSCRPQPKVIRIKVVQPKPCAEAQKQAAPAPQKQQAVSAPPEVMLVPRTVFVPFVAQTPTGPARVLSLQGAVPLIAPSAEQKAIPEAQKEVAPAKEEKKECPPPAKVEIMTSCPPDLEGVNRRLDRLEGLLQQLCPPPCPPPVMRRRCPD
jgi:hypothetical protein